MFPSCFGRSLIIYTPVRVTTSFQCLYSSKEMSLSQTYRIMNVKKSSKKKQRKKHLVIKRVAEDIEAVWLENLTSNNLKLFRKTSFGSFRKINLDNLFEKLKQIYPTTFGKERSISHGSNQDSSLSPEGTPPPKSTKDLETSPPPKSSKDLETNPPPKPGKDWEISVPPKPSKDLETSPPPKPSKDLETSPSPKPGKDLENSVPPKPSKDVETSPPPKPSKEAAAKPRVEEVNSPPCLSEYMIKHLMEFPLLRTNEETSFCKYAKKEVEDFGAVDAVMYPSVTGILNETMSPTARLRLKLWKEKMIEDMGLEGFQKYQEDLLHQGSKFHATLKSYLELPDKNLVTIDPEVEGCWRSLEYLLPDVTDVRYVEESVYHPILLYKGIVDCVATFRGTPCVIEWKKSNKPKRDLTATYDAPLQLCAYLGALPWHKNVTNVQSGLVVVAYTDGAPANAFELSLESCEYYWMEWLRRVQSYWLKKSSIVLEDKA